MITVLARRYECQQCGACMIVVPGDVLPGRLYSASAIALALALWALLGMVAATVRARVSPFPIVGAAAAGRWVTLRRWARDAASRRLFATSRAAPADFTLRQTPRERCLRCVLSRRLGLVSSMPSSLAVLFTDLRDADLGSGEHRRS
jgi:hypothetical protein